MADEELTVPELAGENHVCPSCDLTYAHLPVVDALRLVAEMPDALRMAVAAVPPVDRPVRPDDATWSVGEYVCHIRDAIMTATIRLHRATTEDRPVVEPMLNDLRARRFGYARADVDAVVEQIEAAVDGFVDEVERVADDEWDRQLVRRHGEARTARWVVRHAAHEACHHLSDVVSVGDAVASARRITDARDVATLHAARGRASDAPRVAYQVTDLKVHDWPTFMEYAKLALPLVGRHGGVVVGVSRGRVDTLEGDWTPSLLVIHRWPDRTAFDAFYSDDDYIEVRRLRERSTESAIVVFEADQ